MEEPWIERIIREAQEAGKLEVIEGAGEPIAGLSAPYDPAWWARNWIERERARDRTVALSKEIERMLPTVLSHPSIDTMRRELDALNARIAAHNELNPKQALPLLDVDGLVAESARRRAPA